MAAEPDPASSPALDPKTWTELLTAHAVKGDMFSARTLMTIQQGVEKLNLTRHSDPARIEVTRAHAALFERLRDSFNNPALLKEVGVAYLEDFRLPATAVKHFELAREFAPKDRDLEQLQTAAALAMARELTDQSGHSGLDEAVHAKPEVGSLIRKTSKLTLGGEAQKDLDETADELSRKQVLWRKTGAVKQPTAPDFTETLNRAQNLIAVGDFVAASTCLTEARKAGAPVEELKAYYAQLGLTAYNVGRMTEALNAFLHMRDVAPAAIEGWFNCGLVHQKMGKLDEALAAYTEAARLAPDNSKIWCNMSSVWFERGDYSEAEHTARKAIELKPDYARAWDNLASALSSMNRLPEAAEACQQAIHIQPSLHSAWFKFGVIQFQLDSLVKATEAFNLAGDHEDFAAYVLYYMSMIEARRGELDKARYKLTEARASDPANDLETPALKEIGTAYTKAGRHATAAEFYGQITEKHPDDFSAWLAAGTALHRAENFDRAREAYQRASELQPASPVPWHNLGLLAAEADDREESHRCFQREVELAPEDAKAWYDLGVSLQRLGHDAESATAFERAESLVSSLTRRSSDLSAAMSIVRRLNLGERVLKTE